jgi:quercetin dioxygenase-like cupin family protein
MTARIRAAGRVMGGFMSLTFSLDDAGGRGRAWHWAHVAGLGIAALLGVAAAMWHFESVTSPAVDSLVQGFPIERHDPLPMASENTAAAARPRSVQHPIACEKLPNVPGKSITTVLVEFPPNALTPAHRHPGSVTAYVLKGALRSQLNGGPVESFGVGGTWFEPPGTVHNMVENASATEPAELMAIFVADSDCGALTVFEQ